MEPFQASGIPSHDYFSVLDSPLGACFRGGGQTRAFVVKGHLHQAKPAVATNCVLFGDWTFTDRMNPRDAELGAQASRSGPKQTLTVSLPNRQRGYGVA